MAAFDFEDLNDPWKNEADLVLSDFDHEVLAILRNIGSKYDDWLMDEAFGNGQEEFPQPDFDDGLDADDIADLYDININDYMIEGIDSDFLNNPGSILAYLSDAEEAKEDNVKPKEEKINPYVDHSYSAQRKSENTDIKQESGTKHRSVTRSRNCSLSSVDIETIFEVEPAVIIMSNSKAGRSRTRQRKSSKKRGRKPTKNKENETMGRREERSIFGVLNKGNKVKKPKEQKIKGHLKGRVMREILNKSNNVKKTEQVNGVQAESTPEKIKRENHNKAEKARRDEIKELLKELEKLVPSSVRNEKSTKTSVLGGAMICIAVEDQLQINMERRKSRLERRKSRLERRKSRLERRKSRLQKKFERRMQY